MTNMTKKCVRLVTDGIDLDLESTKTLVRIDIRLTVIGGTGTPPAESIDDLSSNIFNSPVKINKHGVTRISVLASFKDGDNEPMYLDDPNDKWQELVSESSSTAGGSMVCDSTDGCSPDSNR